MTVVGWVGKERISRIQLFRDETVESRKASYLLGLSRRNFQELLKGKDFMDCDFILPAVFSTIGTFQGLDEIEAFARSKLP